MGDVLTIKDIAKKYGVEEYQVRYALKTFPKIFKPKRVGWQIVVEKKNLPKKWPVGRK